MDEASIKQGAQRFFTPLTFNQLIVKAFLVFFKMRLHAITGTRIVTEDVAGQVPSIGFFSETLIGYFIFTIFTLPAYPDMYLHSLGTVGVDIDMYSIAAAAIIKPVLEGWRFTEIKVTKNNDQSLQQV